MLWHKYKNHGVSSRFLSTMTNLCGIASCKALLNMQRRKDLTNKWQDLVFNWSRQWKVYIFFFFPPSEFLLPHAPHRFSLPAAARVLALGSSVSTPTPTSRSYPWRDPPPDQLRSRSPWPSAEGGGKLQRGQRLGAEIDEDHGPPAWTAS
jgi:hypothetical protein